MLRAGRSFSGREKNCAFLNTGAERFACVSASSGFDFPDDARGLAVTDWDMDGDLDVWVSNRNAPQVRLLRNELPRPGPSSLAVRLEGNGETTNRDAIGARIELIEKDASGRRDIRTLRAGEGFLAQSSKWVYFGLGSIGEIEGIRVDWPAGESETFAGVTGPGRYVLKQGSGHADAQAPRADTLALEAGEAPLPKASSNVRVPLVLLLPFPPIQYRDPVLGALHKIPTNRGKATLITLWASWCAPCIAELQEMGERAGEIRGAGIEVIALNVDDLGDERGDSGAAARALEGFPFTAGLATPELLETIQGLHDIQFKLDLALGVPMSFLIDARGHLSVIYKGRVEIDQLLQDAHHSEGTRLERWERAASAPGTQLEGERIEAAAVQADLRLRMQLALSMQRTGRIGEAIANYFEAVRCDPDCAEAHNNLGTLLGAAGQLQEAVGHLERAAMLKPGDTHILTNLGNMRLRQGKYAEAIDLYERALAAQPGNDLARDALAEARQRFATGGE